MAKDDDFFDTNILLHLLSGETAKAQRAEELVAEGGTVSVQVLNEFVHVAGRKLGLSWPEIEEFLSVFKSSLRVDPVTPECQELAVRIAKRYGYTIYDSSIVAAAILAGARVLHTEDMQHGQDVDGISIRNPFRGPLPGLPR